MEIVAILDAGSQYGKLIDRNIRGLHVLTELLPLNTPAEKLLNYKGIIVSGGPGSVYEKDAVLCDPKIFDLNIPYLGICYGMQLLNYFRGGKVEKTLIREDGQEEIKLETNCPLFDGLSQIEKVLLTHGDSVTTVGENLQVVGHSKNGIITALADVPKKIFGLQFHPEVNLTIHGEQIFHNFLFNICKLSGSYTDEDKLEKILTYIKNSVKEDENVLVLCSGGVDSSVCAAAMVKALGAHRVYGLFVDTGLMRKNEGKLVTKALKDLGLNLLSCDARDDFLNGKSVLPNGEEIGPLCSALNPEEKRKIIGDTFMKVAQSKLSELKLNPEKTLLAQGTLRPDLIESASHMASGTANTIKTHHNDTPLVRQLRSKGKVLEPLKDFHKDEVRIIGTSLGLPKEIVERQPFPGPGLGVRILCSEKPFIDETFHETNKKLKEFCESSYPNYSIQLLPVKSVGVQGDGRSYKYPAAVFGPENWEILCQITHRLPTIFHSVNRVVYVFNSSAPEKEITEITPTYVDQNSIEQLWDADDIVNSSLASNKLITKISQFPVILLPVNFGISNHRSIVLRPFLSVDFMTGVPVIPGNQLSLDILHDMVSKIEKVPKIIKVMYDLTPKPPGTTEWE